MGEGKGLRLYVLIGAIMLGLLAGVTAIFWDEEGSFEGSLVETVKDIESNEDEGTIDEVPNCVIATDDDFSGTVNGEFSYIGSSDCVKIPHVIKGVEVTSYRSMFKGTRVSKVVSDNLNVTNMSAMFFESQATELDLGSFNTSNVTDMYGMFADSKATEIKGLENFETSKVTNMYSMFTGSQATQLDLSSFDTSNVTDMTWMFWGSKATELDLSSFNTSNVTNMRWMFKDSEAKELDLSSFDTSNVTDMNDMFDYSEVKTVYARTQEDADKLNASIKKPNGLQVIVKDIESNEDEGTIDDGPNCVIATDDDFIGTSNGRFIYIGSADCVEIPHVIKGVDVTSYQYMFSGTSVSKVISDNLNVTDMSWMFSSSQATELDVSSFDTSKVTTMSHMFSSSQATELDLSNFNTSNVTDMSHMFNGSKATQLDLSRFDTSNVTDMSRMFSDSQATELDLSNFNTSNVTNMIAMFFESKATELDLSSFDTTNVTDMVIMFVGSQTKTVYVRTQVDADKFNASSDKPKGLQIVAKQ